MKLDQGRKIGLQWLENPDLDNLKRILLQELVKKNSIKQESSRVEK